MPLKNYQPKLHQKFLLRALLGLLPGTWAMIDFSSIISVSWSESIELQSLPFTSNIVSPFCTPACIPLLPAMQCIKVYMHLHCNRIDGYIIMVIGDLRKNLPLYNQPLISLCAHSMAGGFEIINIKPANNIANNQLPMPHCYGYSWNFYLGIHTHAVVGGMGWATACI